ncbi:MAG: hypothetical protein HQK56_19120 [Deltaproteobacteria bacterium]|nr:hypothetical protein [Deltaproteobacteria bacterium]
MDKGAKERLLSKVFTLESLDLEQKMEIVRQRLIWAGGGFQNEIDGLLSSCKREIEEVLLKDEASPRQVIRAVNSLVEKLNYPASLNLVEAAIKQGTGSMSLPVERPTDVLKSFFEEEREKIIYSKFSEPIRKETIIEALHLYFANRGPATPYQVAKLTEDAKIGLTIKIQSSGPGSTPKTIDFLMETTVNGTSLIGAFKRLRNRITAGTATCSFFLRDYRTQIPTKIGGMPKTVAERDEFIKAGGVLAYLEGTHLADLQALVYTANAVGSGDLSFTGQSGERQEIDRDMFNIFVRDAFQSDFISGLERHFLTCPAVCAPLPPRPAPPADPIEKILAILKTPPFKYKLESIAYALENKYKIILSQDELAVCIGKHAERISQIPISPPIYYLRPKR